MYFILPFVADWSDFSGEIFKFSLKTLEISKSIEPKCKIPKAATVKGGVLWGRGANTSKTQCSTLM